MSKKEYKGYTQDREEEVREIEAKQEEICRMVRRIWCMPLLEKAEDFMRRVYRRGSR